MLRDYKKIRVWQAAKAAKKFSVEVYKFTRKFSKEEIYGLTSQLRRAAVSVAANIAEGATRQHKRDYLNFLYIAKSSLSETECLLSIALDLNYLNTPEFNHLEGLSQEIAKSLYGLIKSVESEI